MQMFGFWRSLAAYRVRIALNLKGIAFTETMIDLDRGDQHAPEFLSVNPEAAVPALLDAGQAPITQSMAILEYLEESHPSPPLLPSDPRGRARVRSLSAVTVSDSHPLVVPRVQSYLSGEWDIDEPRRMAWNAHWFRRGLDAYEARLRPEAGSGRYCHGDQVSIADVCLASHLAGAQRFKLDLSPFPTIRRIHEACMAQDAFAAAHPLRQPGAPAG